MSLETRASAAARGLRSAVAVDTEAGLSRLRHTHRRRSAARLGAAGVLVAATILAGAALIGDADGPEPVPAGPPSNLPSPSRPAGEPKVVVIPDARPQQVTVEATITSDVTPGEKLLDSSATSDPAYDDDGSIELSVGDSGSKRLRVAGSCAGAPDAWYVMVIEPNATFIDTGRCDQASVAVGGADYNEEYAGTTLRMFVTDQNPRAFRECFEYSPPEGCDDLEQPLRGTNATMRLSTYEWHPGPTAVRMFGQPFPARANAFDQTWSLVSAAAAATGDRTLSFRVDASSNDGIAQVVYLVRDSACRQIDGCVAGRPPLEHDSLPTVELSIDGEVADDPPREGPFFTRATWGELTSGQAHDIAIRLVGGDPSAVDVGVVVYEANR